MYCYFVYINFQGAQYHAQINETDDGECSDPEFSFITGAMINKQGKRLLNSFHIFPLDEIQKDLFSPFLSTRKSVDYLHTAQSLYRRFYKLTKKSAVILKVYELNILLFTLLF